MWQAEAAGHPVASACTALGALGLVPLLVQEIFGVIATARCEGTTVLLIEKNAFSALGIANNHYVLTNGRILLSRPCKALLSDDAAQAVYLEVWAGRGDAEPRGSPDFEGRN